MNAWIVCCLTWTMMGASVLMIRSEVEGEVEEEEEEEEEEDKKGEEERDVE